jgi:hypothetical protein
MPICRPRRGSGGGCGAAGAVDGGMSRPVACLAGVAAPVGRQGYAAHVRGYLILYLGTIPLAALTSGDVQAMFTAVIRDETVLGRPVSAATLHRIHATLRAALNGAVRAGLIAVNPGRFPELPKAARPRPQVWTPALSECWQLDGWRLAAGCGPPPRRRSSCAGCAVTGSTRCST